MRMRLNEIAKLCGGVLAPGSNGNLMINSVESDSRKCTGEQNVLFAAFSGDSFDGHAFVGRVLENKNCAAIIEKSEYMRANALLVSDVRKALYDLALNYRYKTLSAVKCAAITGSVGKTTTKDMIHLALSASFNAYKSPGNQNSVTGLPMGILNMASTYDIAVLELGMSARHEIKRLSLLARPDIAVVTNVGWSHIAALGSRENIRDEKLDIVTGMLPGTTLLLNGDDELLNAASISGINTVFYSTENKGCAVYAENIELNETSSSFTVVYGNQKHKIFLPVSGIHNVRNALAAYAVAVYSGADAYRAANSFSEFVPLGQRQNICVKNGIKIIVDCYNASPQSMESALSVLSTGECDGKRYAVLGDMLELGEFSEKLHRLVGEYVAQSRVDYLVCFGSEARMIADEAQGYGFPRENTAYFEAGDFDGLSLFLKSALVPGDAVLFKASNRMNLGEAEKRTFEKKEN